MKRLRDDKDFLSMYRDEGDCFNNLISRATYLAHYSRKDPDETWTDTILRVVDANCDLDKGVEMEERKSLFHMMWTMQCLPPGRGLWVGGVSGIPADAQQNCWYTTIRDRDEWGWVMNQLMLGGGVGVGLLHIDSLPQVERGEGESAHLCLRLAETHPDFTGIHTEHVLSHPRYNTPYSVSHTVEDSREGWVTALKLFLRCAFTGMSAMFDFSYVRETGAPLKRFGGKAGGPGPLIRLFKEAWSIIRAAAGRKLNSVECLDVTNHVGRCVKSGNLRRCLPKGTLVHTKEGLVPIQSIKVGTMVLTSGVDHDFNKPTREDYRPVTAVVQQGVQEILVLHTPRGVIRCTAHHRCAVKSGTGVVFKEARHIRAGDQLVFVHKVVPGKDSVPVKLPKVFSSIVDRAVHESAAIEAHWFYSFLRAAHAAPVAVEYDDAVNLEVKLPFSADVAGICDNISSMLGNLGVVDYEFFTVVTTMDGYSLRIQNRAFAAAYKDEYMTSTCFYEEDALHLSRLRSEARAAVLAGIVDACLWRYNDVVACGLPSSIRELQLAYATLGISCNVVPAFVPHENLSMLCLADAASRRQFKYLVFPLTATKPQRLIEFSDEYTQGDVSESDVLSGVPVTTITRGVAYEATYDIEVETAAEFVIEYGFLVHNSAILQFSHPEDYQFRDAKKSYSSIISHRHTSNNSIAFTNKTQFKNFDWLGLATDNLNFGDPGIVNFVRAWQDDPDVEGLNPCGEIFLLSRESCNLCEFFPWRSRPQDILKLLQLLSRFAFRQRLMEFEDAKTESVRKKKMRVGLGIGGVCDSEDLTPAQLRAWYSIVRETSNTYADTLGVERPHSVTTVKPSGTLSILAESSAGMHAAHAPYYVRRLRLSKNTDLAHALDEAGVPSETDLTDKRVGVYDFPMKAVNKRVTTQTETIKDQFERQLMLQQNWADNAVSATISFPRENVEEMAAMLREYVPKLKSSSFLTKEHGYKQAPLEAITEEEYVKRRDAINHYHPLTHGGEFDTSDCAGGACPIK